jgi:xylulokinase
MVGAVCVGAANELRVPVGLPVWNGLGDAGASTVASGVRESGDAYVYLGTTAWVARIAATDSLALPSRVFALAHPDRDKTIEVAPLLSGGDCVQWALELLSVDLQTLNARMNEVDRNPPDLMFLPYLKGERSPFVDSDVRGGFLFADRTHGAAQCFYAVMEGVAFSLKANMDALGANCRKVRLLGGGGRSAVWPQLIADALEMEVEVAAVPGAATAFGAYCVAAKELGGETGAQLSAVRAMPRADRIERTRLRYAQFSRATTFVRELAREAHTLAEPRLARQA